MRDLLIRRVYSFNGVDIIVEIDFIKKTVSLVDKFGKPKRWLFAERTPQYLTGWILILDAMKNAVTEAQTIMDKITEKEYEDFVNLMAAIDMPLKGVGKQS